MKGIREQTLGNLPPALLPSQSKERRGLTGSHLYSVLRPLQVFSATSLAAKYVIFMGVVESFSLSVSSCSHSASISYMPSHVRVLSGQDSYSLLSEMETVEHSALACNVESTFLASITYKNGQRWPSVLGNDKVD